MSPRARALVATFVFAAGAASCGQQGPLVLPADARPIERVEPTAENAEQSDDEGQDER